MVQNGEMEKGFGLNYGFNYVQWFNDSNLSLTCWEVLAARPPWPATASPGSTRPRDLSRAPPSLASRDETNRNPAWRGKRNLVTWWKKTGRTKEVLTWFYYFTIFYTKSVLNVLVYLVFFQIKFKFICPLKCLSRVVPEGFWTQLGIVTLGTWR